MEEFWMVYGVNQGCPTVRHRSEESAVHEAKRLARESPGTRFVVLRSVRCFRSVEPVEELDLTPSVPW